MLDRMTRRCWLRALLSLTIAGCGGAGEPDRVTRTTPEVPPAAAPAPAPVTAAERRVIRGWSDEMRHGDVKAAAKYFSVPSQSVGVPDGGAELGSAHAVEEFNAAFPCGAKLLGVERATGHLIVADFVLTSRPGAECGPSEG